MMICWMMFNFCFFFYRIFDTPDRRATDIWPVSFFFVIFLLRVSIVI